MEWYSWVALGAAIGLLAWKFNQHVNSVVMCSNCGELMDFDPSSGLSCGECGNRDREE